MREGLGNMLTIDGSQGEGGGQILRTSLSLSLITGRPFRIINIRAGRAKPGLMRQHLTAVTAAQTIGEADVSGDTPGSKELTFSPRTLKAGEYHFAVGTAGSAMLVFQTVLPALLHAGGRSTLTLEGGTHNPHAPPFDFVQRSFLPLLLRMGHRIEATLERPGFYPAGGGKCVFAIEPTALPEKLELLTRGEIKQRKARAVVSGLHPSIAERELNIARQLTGWDESAFELRVDKRGHGPGNIFLLELEGEPVTEVFVGFGEHGVRAETVAENAVRAMREYLVAEVPVGEYLADQLILPLATGAGGSYRTMRPTPHTLTNVEVVRAFLRRDITIVPELGNAWRITINRDD